MKRPYYLLLAASIVSNLGDWMFKIALPLLVYKLTSSAFSMAFTYGLTFLPYLLFLPFGGVLADRVDRRRLLICGDVLSAILVGLLAWYAWCGLTNMWIIYPTIFLLAGVVPFYHPAFQGMLPSLVNRENLPKANAWQHSAENLIALGGPALAGLLIAWRGTTCVLFLDACSFVVSALLICGIRGLQRVDSGVQKAETSWLQDLRDGIEFVRTQSTIRSGALLFTVTNFATTLIQANYIFFLAKQLRLSATEVGIALAIPGVGAILGACAASRMARHIRPGNLILMCTIFAGVLTLPMLFAWNMVSASVPWALVTALGTTNMVTWFALRQDEQVVPKRMLGRVVAITRLMSYAAIPLAAVLGGALLNWTHNFVPLIVCASLLRLVAGGLGLRSPLYSRTPREPLPLEEGEHVAASG